ncbi:MAG: metallopeptidase family protein [Candidatus Omnitrophica bacterium]|nr:metallopeptidase family protein [Candidatus Omnitrophota bacterium]
MKKHGKKIKFREKSLERAFESLVRGVLKDLPREFQRKLENISVTVQAEPTACQKREAGTGPREELLGLYEGVPLGERTHQYGNVLPDKITIFRGPVTRSCRTPRQMRTAVRDTVLHEIAHYFGITDEHMLESGTY